MSIIDLNDLLQENHDHDMDDHREKFRRAFPSLFVIDPVGNRVQPLPSGSDISTPKNLNADDLPDNWEPLTEDQREYLLESEKLAITSPDVEPALSINNNVRTRLSSYCISLDNEYKKVLKKISKVMGSTANLSKPVVITARPGLGKTEILIATLIEKSKADSTYAALVVTRRVEDAIRIRDAVNQGAGEEICKIRPSFSLMTVNGQKCLNGYNSEKFKDGICTAAQCDKSNCEVKSWHKTFKDIRIGIVTSVFFTRILDNSLPRQIETSDLLLEQQPLDVYPQQRCEVFIDENPGMIFNPVIDNKMLNDCMKHLKSNAFADAHIKEFASIMAYISPLFAGAEQHEHLPPERNAPSLSPGFFRAWLENPHSAYQMMPSVISEFLLKGGISQNGISGVIEYAIGVSKYREIEPFPVRVTILDGTGIHDQTYRQKEFHFLNIPEVRDFSRCTIYHYAKNLTKSHLQKNTKTKLKSIINEACRVIGDDLALLITYKKHESKISKLLAVHADGPDVKINHFGNLIGRNDYRDCKVVFFVGINDWGSLAYLTQVAAVTKTTPVLTTKAGGPAEYDDPNVGEFRTSLTAISLYQDLMRSNLRVSDSIEPVRVYLWSDSDKLAAKLSEWLPGSKVENCDVPPELLTAPERKQLEKSLTPDEIARLDAFKLTDGYASYTKPKKRAPELAKFLGRVPNQQECEYLWVELSGHYDRYKMYAERALSP